MNANEAAGGNGHESQELENSEKQTEPVRDLEYAMYALLCARSLHDISMRFVEQALDVVKDCGGVSSRKLEQTLALLERTSPCIICAQDELEEAIEAAKAAVD